MTDLISRTIRMTIGTRLSRRVKASSRCFARLVFAFRDLNIRPAESGAGSLASLERVFLRASESRTARASLPRTLNMLMSFNAHMPGQ